MEVSFIGLGKMGLPMAKNILKAGFPMNVYNRSPGKVRNDELSGAHFLNKPDDTVKDADVVITMVTDDDAVRQICQQILPSMKKGSIHLSMSTIAPATATELTLLSKKYDVVYLAAPVMGRPPAAGSKQLFILLSGNNGAKKDIEPLLLALGQRVFDYGENPSAANTVKLIMNYMIFVIIEMLSEVTLVAEKAGIEKQTLLDTMTSTIFGAPVFRSYGSLVMEEKDNPNGFATRLASKDLRLMQETASGHHMALPLAEIIQGHFKEIITQQGGDKDVSQLISHLRTYLKR